MQSSLTDENRDLRKQSGCMNSIFHLFDRQHFWRISSHNQKRLLLGTHHDSDPHHAAKTIIEKDLEVQKPKSRVFMESSLTSHSNSSGSSTSSSLDYNRTAKTVRSVSRVNVSESPQNPDIRDVVKESMYREPRVLSIQSRASGERKGHVMKHIDSPRPSHLSKPSKSKPTGYEGSTHVLAEVQGGTKSSKDERLTLPPRFSYDERESRETFKPKLKELPRLSLDSKASSLKFSPLDSGMNFGGQYLHMTNQNSIQEPGCNTRSSSIVAKLMGLDDFPDTISMEETKSIPSPKVAFLSKSTSMTEKSNRNQISHSPLSQNNLASTSPRPHSANSARKPTACSKFPMEPAPWRQQDSSQASPKTAPRSTKASNYNLSSNLSDSVYGEIEKRITDLEFRKSSKDLRALKQILEAMQKTRERLENQRRESAELTMHRRCSSEGSCSDQNSNLFICQNGWTCHQAPTIIRPFPSNQLGLSIGTTKSAKMMDTVKISSPAVPTMELQYPHRTQARECNYYMENLACGKKAKDTTPGNNNPKRPSQHATSIDKKTAQRNSDLKRNSGAPRCVMENCTTYGRSFRMVSPRIQENLLRIEEQSHQTTSSSGGVKKHSNKKVKKYFQCPKHGAKSHELQLYDDQLHKHSGETGDVGYQGDTASVKSEGNNSVMSRVEIEDISLAHSIITNSRLQKSESTPRQQIMEVEPAVTMTEQPSPVSVLDAAFYSEDSPSPIKKISTAFQDDGPRSNEAEWHVEDLNNLADCTRSDPGNKITQKGENLLHLVHEPIFFNAENDETAAKHNALVESIKPDQGYINKILVISGLLKDTGIIHSASLLISSGHLINPKMFHVLEEGIDKNDCTKLNHKIQRKIVFDVVNEILVRKITSGGLSALGKKKMSPQRLVEEVYMEMDQLHGMSYCSSGDEDDGFIRLLTADLKYQPEDWTKYSGEVPALVLDTERQIFKDLINEVLR